MAIIKCKMCGGDLNVTEGVTVAECEYCGTKQTVPNVDNEKKLTLFSRANRLRLACEFDKAAGVYENIVAEFPEEAEAYWGLVLCRYGIEYVDDPATGKKVPTCHRSSFDSILEDSDFEQACENADALARRVYREEAKAIEDIRKGILEVSGKEPPYDIFICYKETDESGERTVDSVLAQDVYDALTEKGYRVFFSRITLEDKLGTEYEPYIFAALNSAKIMLAFGTDYEYFNAVWVKNEWSRYLKLMAQDKSKHLIPCYKDVDAYDMPKEFQKLQGQDMGKVGAVQDLLRGIDKLLDKITTVKETTTIIMQGEGGGVSAASLLKRGQFALEDHEWATATAHFEHVLDIEAECAEAYLGLAMAKYTLTNWTDFEKLYLSPRSSLNSETYIVRAQQFATGDLEKRFAELKVEWEKIEQEEAELAQKKAPLLAKKRAEAASLKKLISLQYDWAAGLRLDGTVVLAGNEELTEKTKDWFDITAIIGTIHDIVGLRADGTVILADHYGDSHLDVSTWTEIKELAWYSDNNILGLKSDGTVVTAYQPEQSCFHNWNDVISITSSHNPVGLRADGTVIGMFKIGGDWSDVVSVAANEWIAVGLRADGTVAIDTPTDPETDFGQEQMNEWNGIVSLAVGDFCAAGLRSDGSVVAIGPRRKSYSCDWQDVVAVSAGAMHIVGLKLDGTVVAEGDNGRGQCNVGTWTDIVAIAAHNDNTIAIKSDGTVLVTGENRDGWRDIQEWKLFNNIDTLQQEREDAKKRWQEEQKRRDAERNRCTEEHTRQHAALEAERTDLQTELANLKGLFTGKRRKEIEARLAEIEAELKKL